MFGCGNEEVAKLINWIVLWLNADTDGRAHVVLCCQTAARNPKNDVMGLHANVNLNFAYFLIRAPIRIAGISSSN